LAEHIGNYPTAPVEPPVPEVEEPVEDAVDARPVDARPVDAMPVDAMPVDAAPVDAVPVEAAPVGVTPVEAMRVDAAPVEEPRVEASVKEAPANTPAEAPTEAAEETPGTDVSAPVAVPMAAGPDHAAPDDAAPGPGLLLPSSLEDQLLPLVTRRDRRRARKEVDRLQRECARRPAETDDPESDAPRSDVKVLGLKIAPAEPRWADEPTPVVASPAPAITLPAPALDEEPSGRRDRHRAWRVTERAERAEARHQVRYPIFTRSVLVWLFIFMVAGLAFGGSAAFWWSQFNADVDEIRGETSSFADQVQGAAEALETQRHQALEEIEDARAGLDALVDPGLAPQIAEAAAPSVFFVETRDEAGAAVVGSAFVVANTEDQSLLLTSLDVVQSSTVAPGPEIRLRQGDKDLVAELWSWDADLDLALLVVDDPELPALEWASDEAAAQALSTGIFSVSAQGGLGATAIPGTVVDQSTDGFQHTAVIGTAFRGGPILTKDGQVLGVSSIAYQPLGYDPGDVHFSVPVGRACGTVLACGGAGPTAGAQGGPPVASQEPAAPAGQ
jgi:S1-C subfamily serine protease